MEKNMVKLTELDERLIRRFRLDRAAFEAERARELEKTATQTATRGDAEGLTAEDARLIRRFGLDRARFLETRRIEARS